MFVSSSNYKLYPYFSQTPFNRIFLPPPNSTNLPSKSQSLTNQSHAYSSHLAA